MSNGDKGTKALAATAAGVSIATLITTLLTRPSAAKAAGEGGQVTVVLDQDVREALAAILQEQLNMEGAIGGLKSSLDTANAALESIAASLGAEPVNRMLDYFEKNSITLSPATPFKIDETDGKGALIWGIFQVDDPDVTLILQIDNQTWEYNIDTLNTQGISSPIPGVWVSQYDTTNSVYCLVFTSAGNLAGFPFNSRLIISIRYNGTGTATLTQARGVKWIEV